MDHVIRYWKCTNLPKWVQYLSAIELESGCILEYKGKDVPNSRSGTFKSMRAVKLFVTQNITCIPSKWDIDNN